MILVFDTETTGLIKGNPQIQDVDSFPRIIQLAWGCYNYNGELLEEHCYLIRPFGWEIPKLPFWIEKGFETEKSLREGKDIESVLAFLALDIEVADTIVAHNLDFDQPIVQAEMYRLGMQLKNRPKKVCTMKATTNLLRIPSMRGGYKFPKLMELHQYLFNCEFEGAHDAGHDVRATAKCYFQLLKRGFVFPDRDAPKPPATPKSNINIDNL